ncbi:hypothetical protein ABL78_8080 [Leptomonas seymouri]|uniref:Uncharacterized protein n=1 Tax=Leptomonas seymouri TaxID=5684 RepID=A0A0N0P2F9_LEPSE|nr:hypothetical protein ABL78_8080 [Leptomonas seymouri]|eukprot:KPI82906.1 hypothetical protein ABL78_8080 [Leptomonas seymouri]
MMRLSRVGVAAGCVAALSSSSPVPPVLWQQRRGVRYANIQETLKPIAGQTAGQISILNEICCNPDAEEERRKPTFRSEVAPNPADAAKDENYLHTMHRWGYDSLTLFKKTNEDPGPWWNANSSTLVSNWAQVGDYANAGMWSGVWRYTYGIGEYNLRPYEARGRAWGRKDPKTGAITIHYGKKTKPVQRLCFPHTAEHAQHHRVQNPPNKGVKEISALHGKRILREVQYHLGQGLRFYLVDGVFGSDPATATPYRIITDNPTHAYFASMAAIRSFNYVARQEVTLVKRVTQSPIDEWAWRRPGVLVYHAPSYDFEVPRIVEEFGGPRPKDMSLEHNRFIATEPYSIPMKCALGGEPSCDALLDSTAMLCGRWGFYADEKGFLTVPSESIVSTDGLKLTLVITGNEAIADVLRISPQLYGSRHHRLAGGVVSRAWDVVSMPATAAGVKAQAMDLVEADIQRVQRSLPTRMGLPRSLSHRYHGRRHVSEYGFKWPHNYTEDASSKAYASGHLFKAPKKDELAGHAPRPSHFMMADVDVVVVGDGTDAAAAVIAAIKERGMLYAEEAPLKEAMAAALKTAKRVKVVPAAGAKAVVEKIAQGGTA